MGTVWFDVRYALRGLRRAPWFTALAVLTLALGIGLNTALFSMVDAVLLRVLPFREPDRLVEIFGQDDTRGGMRVPGPIVDALRTRSRTLAALTVHGPIGGALRTQEGPVDVRGDRAWANFNDVMGVAPALGRGFLPHDEQPGSAPVMLVSDGFWRRFLGADPAAVERTLYLDSLAYTVIGVMPPSFRTLFRGDGIEHFWTPHVSAQVSQFEREEGFELFGRLASGVTLAQAQREVAAIAAGVSVENWGPTERRLGMRVLADEVIGDSARILKLAFAAVGLVLVIICANLALLLTARADRRLAEFATRKAIGASAGQLLRLALAECLLLSLAGGAAGVAFAYWLLPFLIALAPAAIPRLGDAAINGRVLAVAAVATIVTACAFGIAPALRLSRLSVARALTRSSSRITGASAPGRAALVLGQVAASVVLCVLAGLVGRTFLTLLPTNPGFAPQSLSTFVLFVDPRIYTDATDRHLRLTQIVARVETAPGVTAVGFAQNVPFSGDDYMTIVRDAALPDAPQLDAERRAVSPNYFQLMRIPLLLGNTFTGADGPATPRVAIVNQTLARKLAETGGVIGRSVRVGRAADAPPARIIGVAADIRSSGSTLDTKAEIYVPFAQSASSIAFLVVRSNLSAVQLTAVIRKEIRTVTPELALRTDQSARSMEEMVSRSLAGPRFLATLSTAFAATALLLAAIGVFGVVAYSVAQRRREFGIRAALGARPRDLAANALSSITAVTVAGIVLGLAAAAYLTRFVESQLYAVERLDPLTFASAAAVMLVVAVLAAAVPSRRAAAVAPMSVLRHE